MTGSRFATIQTNFVPYSSKNRKTVSKFVPLKINNTSREQTLLAQTSTRVLCKFGRHRLLTRSLNCEYFAEYFGNRKKESWESFCSKLNLIVFTASF